MNRTNRRNLVLTRNRNFWLASLSQKINWRKLALTLGLAILLGLLLRQVIAPPVYRVAMVLPGDPDQPGWSSYVLASAGVIDRALQAQGTTARIDYTTTLTAAAGTLSLFAEQGYDLVIAADDSYEAAANKVAAQYPATRFALLADAPGNGKNLGAIALRHEEPGEIAGEVMALKSQTGRVAYLADGKNPRRQQAVQGIRAGVGEADLQVHWDIGGPAEAADLAARLFDAENVDVICIDADLNTMLAVYEVARQRPGKYVSNWQIDLSSLYPDTTLGSYNAALADVLAQAAVWGYTGAWQGRRYSFGAGAGAFNVTPLHNLSDDQKDQVWAGWAKIYDREFEP
ncbi:MAG: hypothetical protein FOGNACKC_05504 [Anaerolineae bacterium]|nr:hypothetical protein [Anaerolineae bacterium]